MQKNFFAILSTIKSRDFQSREEENLDRRTADFYKANNNYEVGCFVYDSLVSKFIHLINKKQDYQNRGRLDLGDNRDLQYSASDIKAILQLYFNREDADCSVLFLSAHGNPKGELILWTIQGEFPLTFQTVQSLWDNRSSKLKNKELLIIVDACFSGSWVFANQSPDIFIQASCSNKEKAKDIRVDGIIMGSVFLHNFLMVNGVTDGFFEGVNQTPTCTFLKGDQMERIRNIFDLRCMMRNWDDFKFCLGDKFRSFSRDSIIWEGPIREVRPSFNMGVPFGGPIGQFDGERRVEFISGAQQPLPVLYDIERVKGPGGTLEENVKRSFHTGSSPQRQSVNVENVKRSFQTVTSSSSSSQQQGGSYAFKFGMK